MKPLSLRRKQRAEAARLLLTLYVDDKLDSPQRWTWEAVDHLPQWCLVSSTDRRYLQLICGALLLSPEFRFWIQKPLLQGLHRLLGEAVFSHVTHYADQMQLPREPLSEFLKQADFVAEKAEVPALEQLLMQSGATVLAATIHESLPRDMLADSLGVGIGSISEAAACAILDVATMLAQKSPVLTTSDAV